MEEKKRVTRYCISAARANHAHSTGRNVQQEYAKERYKTIAKEVKGERREQEK